MAGSMRRGVMQDLPSAPLPQGEPAGPRVVTTQLVNAFWQFLPAKSTTFWARSYFRNYPKPLFIGNLPPFPVPLPIIKLVVPQNQAFVLRSFDFAVYEQSGIGTEDLIAVPPSRVASYFGFEVKVANRSPYDFNTNVTARGQIINYNPAEAGSRSAPPVPGQGTAFPFSGPNQPLGENFATYVMSGGLIEMTVYVLREPVFDARMLSVTFGGYNVNERLLQSILSCITAPCVR
jgi:hypothetical protein